MSLSMSLFLSLSLLIESDVKFVSKEINRFTIVS